MSRLVDKFNLKKSRQLLSGAQAIVRLTLMQKARDKNAGLNTAGYVTGYRGSPLTGFETAFAYAANQTSQNNIVFRPALNEDLAATAIWGTQQANLLGEGKFDGVFAIWYGKGPGVDRSGDAFRHANHAGTSQNGGVLTLVGDDHTCESSTSAHQSDFALMDAMIPILYPSNVQDILDYGIAGFALSRFAGVWVGLKCVKDNAESTATVDASPDRMQLVMPSPDAFSMPPGGLNIRRNDTPLEKEARLHDYKRRAIHAFVRANKLDKLIWSGGPNPHVGIVAAGKSYLDVLQALDELGITEAQSKEIGLKLYKPALSWPLEPTGLAKFAEGLDTIIVVEEKRALIETQIKEQLYALENRPQVIGKRDANDDVLFAVKGALDPIAVAIAIGKSLLKFNSTRKAAPQLSNRLKALEVLLAGQPNDAEAFIRTPYFCAGCPHNTSTKIPGGTRAYAGIGCHYMVQWMDRETEGFTQMGGEGANWIGEAPFSKREHVFQNIGDGTFIHSGSLPLRAAIAANVNITFKLLYNDAVAMTGGQPLEGNMTAEQMAALVMAEGAKEVAIVSETPERFDISTRPKGCNVYHRDELMAVQERLAKRSGVTVLIYDQTCATEKRRRRKRGVMPKIDNRIFINPLVCEGCGDCGKASNCVAILPLETPFGRKRVIDQSACNFDASCTKGFCPSFVMLHDAKPRTTLNKDLATDTQKASNHADSIFRKSVPEPNRPSLDKPFSLLVTGIGGTGVVTISAVLGQAAFDSELGYGAIDVTGLAQKGGAVSCHMRFANDPNAIGAIRVGTAGADAILGGDLVVSASNKVLNTIKPGRTQLVVSSHEQTTGAFTQDPDLNVPGTELLSAIEAHAGKDQIQKFNAQRFAVELLGDSIYANMALLGFAYQKGLVPVSAQAILDAIDTNNTAVENNKRAFHSGRVAAAYPKLLAELLGNNGAANEETTETLEAMVDRFVDELIDYQDQDLADKYHAMVQKLSLAEESLLPGETKLARAVAQSYFKLLAYKDEYEVARLFTDGRFQSYVQDQFTGGQKTTFHMAPPFLAPRDPATGHPRKMQLPGWLLWPLLRLLAKGKRVRGTWLDLFGRTAERQREREMIREYEATLALVLRHISKSSYDTAVQLAGLPQKIRGFGHVKTAADQALQAQRTSLISQLTGQQPQKSQDAAE